MKKHIVALFVGLVWAFKIFAEPQPVADFLNTLPPEVARSAKVVPLGKSTVVNFDTKQTREVQLFGVWHLTPKEKKK